ncbi:MAG TPA: hypothetical protein VKE27_10285, partial [Candidatus Dormibacteraeota bacterium]|nr:hypothetical protein [Candidatus Dormibacteraeota bacterium]
HLALVPGHLAESRFTSALFLGNGLAFLTLAAMVRWRRWRLLSSLLIVATLLGYAVYVAAQLETPDQVGVATKLIELTALGMVLCRRQAKSNAGRAGRLWALRCRS